MYDNGPGSEKVNRKIYSYMFPDTFSGVFNSERLNCCEECSYKQENYFYEEDDNLVFEFPIPGFSKDDVRVQTDDDMFYISWATETEGGEFEDLIPEDYIPDESCEVKHGVLIWKFWRFEEERKDIIVK